MMSNNKVLTVSYGTFSCTLEGFEDSFGTMKAIAEYFRDLASDDRYFGAEPPQPDADMLARIAEKEIARRVQASLDGGRVVLSAAPEEAPARLSASDDAPDAAAQDIAADAAPQTPAQDMAAADTPQAETADTAAPEAGMTETVTPEAGMAEAGMAEAGMAEAGMADADMADAAAPEGEAADTDAQAEIIAQTAEPAGIADTADAAEDIADAQMPEAEPARGIAPGAVAAAGALAGAGAAAAGSSIADKLARIRAVVARSEAEAEAETEDAPYIEDEHAEELVAETPTMSEMIEAAASEDIPAEVEAADEAEADGEAIAEAATYGAPEDAVTPDVTGADKDTDTDTDTDDVASILARLSAEPDAPETDAPEIDAPEPGASEAGIMTDLDPEPQDALEALMEANAEAETPAEAEPEAEDPGIAEPAPETSADAQPAPAARVIKVKRADLEAAIAAGELEEVDPAEADPTDADAPDTSLSDEEEADLMRELAAVEAELPEAADVDGAPEADSEPAAKPEADVDRLMAKADAEMGEPEGAKNRDAFAHLKAAVAARKSDTGLGDDDEDAQEGRYRTDLAAVVKPRRPAPRGDAKGARPQPKAAPLKLVAEQRVDMPEGSPEPKGPVRPRRIAAAPEPATADGSFADYADDMGAQSLPQLLEAAAAYLAFVENRETFSRPQIMNKVRAAQGGEFSREDGLRSFGQLLRAGKIEKLKGGRFAATGEIGYRPDARAAG